MIVTHIFLLIITKVKGDKMEELGRINVYRSLLQDNNTRLSGEMIRLVELNEWILREIEPLFLQENNKEDIEARFSDIIYSIISENTNWEEVIGVLKYDKLLKSLTEIRNSTKKAPNKFNALIKLLSDFNDDVIEGIAKQKQSIFVDEFFDYEEFEKNSYKLFLEKHYSKRKQVFLSYAYEDKLYTIALFFYFQRNDMFLFVDWMNNGKEDKGISLKQKLHDALNRSEQLIFLRTPNSELKIGGNYYIRPWCSWELGNFYDMLGSKDKFFIDLYEHGEINNLQLAGIKLLTDVANGTLRGMELRSV